MEPSTVIAGASALVAVVAAAISWASSRHAKRNADKALGDLPPFIEVFQVEESMFDSHIPAVAVQVTNYNRRAILLTQLDFEVDDRFIAYRAPRDDEEDTHLRRLALSGIVAASTDPDYSHFNYDPPLRLAGNRSLGASPPRYDFEFHITGRDGRDMDIWPAQVRVNIGYGIAGTHGSIQTLRYDLTVHCRPVDSFHYAFRVLPSSRAEDR